MKQICIELKSQLIQQLVFLRVHKQMRSLLSQFYICQKYRSIQILSQTASPLYPISMRISKTKIIHKEHRHDDGYRKRTRRINSTIERQSKSVNSENILLSVNDDTSSQSSSSSIELHLHHLTEQQQGGIYFNNKQIIQSKQTQNGKLDHVLSKQQQSTENKVQAKLHLSNSIKQELEQALKEDQQGPYFFLGDEDEDQQQEDSSQSDSDQEDDMIEVQDEDSDEEDHKQTDQSNKKEDSDDDQDDEDQDDDDDDDEDYGAQFQDEIDMYGSNFKGQSEQQIQQEMNEYEYYQKQNINDMSLPSNFNHYQLPQKDKQEFLNILNQMYYATMVTEKKRKKKRTKQVCKMEKDEGEQQQKVQVGKRTQRKRVLFNQSISYRLFNKAETIEEMIQQQEQFQQLNHVEKGNQKPIMPIQRQRIQQIIPPSESTKKTAQYLQSDKDNQKEKSDLILHQQPIQVLSESQNSNCQNSFLPDIQQQLPQLNDLGQSKQLTFTNDANEGKISMQVKRICDDTQSFGVDSISSQTKQPPILMEGLN